MPPRRSVLVGLATLGATAFTGCLWDARSDSELRLQLEAVPREDLGQASVRTVAEEGPRVHSIVDEGLDDGATAYGRKPLDGSEFLHADGTYYGVHVEENGRETVERPVLDATAVTDADGSVSDWRNLSRNDALTLRCAVSTRDRADVPPCVVYGGNDSEFWPEPRFRYLERGDEGYYRLDVSERSVDLDRYEYTFEAVAENRSAFADYVARESVAIDFSAVDLTAEQREILETAAAEGSYRESPPPYSPGLEALVDRIESARQRAGTRDVYVRFDGDYYLADFVQFHDT